MILLKGGNTGGIRRRGDGAKPSLVVSKALCQQLVSEVVEVSVGLSQTQAVGC